MPELHFKPLGTGFCFMEGPRADTRGVWFTDVVLGGFRCLHSDGKVDEFLVGKKWIGGLAINDDGAILYSGEGGIHWLNPLTGEQGVLIDAIDGQPMWGVNDMQPDDSGGLIFGTHDVPSIMSGKMEFRPVALYRLSADRRVTKLWDGLKFSNGIGLSPDGKRLYHNESFAGTFAYDIQPDGSLANRTLFSADESCDGLAVDSAGGVWIVNVRDHYITRVLPDGKADRRITLPGPHPVSLCFGGADWRDIYVATAADGAIEAMFQGAPPPRSAGVYHARSDIPGRPVGRTRFKLAAK